MHLLSAVLSILGLTFLNERDKDFVASAHFTNDKIVIRATSHLPDKSHIFLKQIDSEDGVQCERIIGDEVCVFRRFSDESVFRLVLTNDATTKEVAVLMPPKETAQSSSALNSLIVAAITMISSVVGFYARVQYEKKKEIDDSKKLFLFQLRQVHVGLNSGEDAQNLLTIGKLFPESVIIGSNQYSDETAKLLDLIFQLSKEPQPISIDKTIEIREKFNAIAAPLIA